MAKRTDIKKVLIIGSGPIVIGQAAEFDYAGTQACLALKEEGYQVILCNSNPATIMTDVSMADKVYMEPLNLEYIAKILRYERPDAIVPGIGGQTGLNLAVQLDKKGVLKECGVKLLGTPRESIEKAEDRELFKEMCMEIGEPVIPSKITYDIEEAKQAAKEILPTTKRNWSISPQAVSRLHRSIRSWWKRASKATRKSNLKSCAIPPITASRSAAWRMSIRSVFIPAIRWSLPRSFR